MTAGLIPSVGGVGELEKKYGSPGAVPALVRRCTCAVSGRRRVAGGCSGTDDELAADAGVDHTVRKRNRVVAVAVRTFVAATEGLRPHVDLDESSLELRRCRLGEQSSIIDAAPRVS